MGVKCIRGRPNYLACYMGSVGFLDRLLHIKISNRPGPLKAYAKVFPRVYKQSEGRVGKRLKRKMVEQRRERVFYKR
jgi:hypothetical protein